MIKEICQFVETLEEQAPDLFEEGAKLKEGIYVALDIGLEDGKYVLKNVDENGNILKEDIGLFTKKEELTPFFEKCRKVLQSSNPVDKNKSFNPNLKIFNVTCSPYVVGFTKKGILSNIEKIRKDGTTVGRNGILNELTNQYFKKAGVYIEEGPSSIWFNSLKSWLTANFWELIEKIGFNNLKEGHVIVFFLKEVDIKHYKKPYLKYVGENVFNKAEYNTIFQDITYGVSDSLNTFNDKKSFLKHQTASFRYNYRIDGNDAQSILKFFQIGQKLPNPLPIFVHKEEASLNADVVKLFNNEGVAGYSEIIRSLLYLRKTNLQNFYLLFLSRGKIIDLDFVPVFKYTLKDKAENDFTLKEIFGAEPVVYFSSKDHNVFDFQFMVVNPIFNNQLVQKTKAGTLWLKYFDEIKVNPEYDLTDAIYNLLYKYRKAWYDFIFKSKQQIITMTMINEMFIESIIDDLRHDEGLKEPVHMRKKLSLWFGLQPLFDNNFNTNSMANKTVELQTKIREIAQTGSFHITTDDEFAFAAGQLIWKLLIQSESANRSHALLEPFLQKTEPVLFKQAIASTFNMYKYKFTLYPTKYEFDKLFSEVMGYDPDLSNMKEHLPMILAGYFSESIFKQH
ncbi:MAG: hypothetical protein QMB82_04925 [Bacteroidales bacterium]